MLFSSRLNLAIGTKRRTHTHNRLTAFCWDYPGRPVPEETFTHSHPSWSSDIFYHLPPFTTSTHTHLFNGSLSGTTRVSRFHKGKTNLDFTGARDSEWQWHQLDHMQVCTALQTDSHANSPPLSFLQAGCPSCHPTNSVKALKGYHLWAKEQKRNKKLKPKNGYAQKNWCRWELCQNHCRLSSSLVWLSICCSDTVLLSSGLGLGHCKNGLA